MREAIPTIRVRTRNGTLLARDGVILCFFMRRSHEEVVPAVWRALQAYLRAIPPRAIGWYHSSSGEKLPFNEDGKAGTHYAGEQPQNSRNTSSVSQYDTACMHQR